MPYIIVQACNQNFPNYNGLTSINFTENSDGSDSEILQLGHPVEK